MKILRAIAANIVGYLVFAVASMMLVGLVIARQGPLVVVVALVALTLIGLAAGWIAAAIAGSYRRLASYILAGLVAIATIANLVMGFGAEPVWYKVGALVLTAPAILLVGLRGKPEMTLD